MKLQDRFVVSGSPEAVADFMLDIDRVSHCVPEVHDVKEIAPNTYEANLVVQFGPIKATFVGSVRADAGQAPARLAAVAEGRDRASGSVAKVVVDARLEQLPENRTGVEIDLDLAIRGKLGQFGTAVIRSTASALIKDFAKCLDARLTAQLDSAVQPPSVPRRGRVFRIAFAAMRAYISDLWRALRKLSPRRGREEAE